NTRLLCTIDSADSQSLENYLCLWLSALLFLLVVRRRLYFITSGCFLVFPIVFRIAIVADRLSKNQALNDPFSGHHWLVQLLDTLFVFWFWITICHNTIQAIFTRRKQTSSYTSTCFSQQTFPCGLQEFSWHWQWLTVYLEAWLLSTHFQLQSIQGTSIEEGWFSAEHEYEVSNMLPS